MECHRFYTINFKIRIGHIRAITPVIERCYDHRLICPIGVWWDKTRNKWGAGINPGTGKISLGRFKEKKDAATCRREAEKKYNFQNCNSTSSAYIFLKKEGVL